MNKNPTHRESINGGFDSEIKFAGNDNKVKMYEPKHRRKLVRVLTVVAYVFSVSLAAIMLSLFYIFVYSPGKSVTANNSGAQQKLSDDSITAFNITYSNLEGDEPRVLPLQQLQEKRIPVHAK